MDSLGTLCILGIIFVVVMMVVVPMLRRNAAASGAGPNYSQRGPEYRQYDDPNIESGGGIGRPATPPQSNYTSRKRSFFPTRPGGYTAGPKNPFSAGSQSSGKGGIGSSGSRTFGGSKGGRADSPDIESRGGIGRDKS